jgi:hypothetical protein
MVDHHRPLEASIVGRRRPTWADCAEIAEVAMLQTVWARDPDRSDPTTALVYAVLSASGATEVFVPTRGEVRI